MAKKTPKNTPGKPTQVGKRPPEKIPAVAISPKARAAAQRKIAAAHKLRLAARLQKYGPVVARLHRLRDRIAGATSAAAKAQRNLAPALHAAVKATEARRGTPREGGVTDAAPIDDAPIAALDAAERPFRLILKALEGPGRAKLQALIANTLGLPQDSKVFSLAPLFPKLGKKNKSLGAYWVAEFAADRRSAAAIMHRVADALRRTGVFASVRPEALRMGLFSGGGSGAGNSQGLTMAPPADTDWFLTSPETNGFDWRGYRDGLDVYGAWDILNAGQNGERAGEGFTIGHPDSGFRIHGDYPADSIDLQNAFNAFLGGTTPSGLNLETQNVARHGVVPRGFPYFEMHGTFTASVIVAPRQEAGTLPVTELVGVAPGATVLPLRCVNTVILAGDMEIIAAVEHAIERNVDVISISLGGAPNPALRDALATAVEQGIIVVAAAGQSEGAPIPQAVAAPACYPEVIAVGGAIGPVPWEGCFFGPEVDVCAPAVNIRHATFRRNGDGRLTTSQGTSFATAITAGLATLWLQAHGGRQAIEQAVPGVPIQQVFRHLLKETAVDTTIFAPTPPPGGWNTSLYGAGLVNARGLVQHPLPLPEDVPPIDPNAPFNVYGAASGIAILDVGEPWSLGAANWVLTTIGELSATAQAGFELAGDVWNEFAADPIGSTEDYVGSIAMMAQLFDAALAAELARGMAEDAMAAAGSVAGELGDMLAEMAEDTAADWDEAEDAVDQALDEAGDAVEEFVEDTGSFIEDTAETASETAGEVAGAVADAIGGLFG